jgi:hypothetical protein
VLQPRRRATRIARWVWLALGLTALLMGAMAALPWLRLAADQIPFHRIAVGLLVGLGAVYLAALAFGLVALAVFVQRYRTARRFGRPRGASLRGLVAAAAVLLGVAMVEAASAAWLAWESWSRSRSLASSGLVRDFPLPTEFPEASAPAEINLVVVGESSAVGFPCQQWLSLGRILAWQLEQAIPGRRFHIELVAHEGDTLEQQHQALSRIRRRPDAVIVYCGHNELVARYPAHRDVSHYRAGESRSQAFPPALGAARWSCFCRLLERIGDRHRVGIPPGPVSTRPVADVPVFTESEFDERVSDFHGRLERIAAFCEQVGALAVLVIPPGNDAGFEPNRSFLSPQTDGPGREQLSREFLAIRQAEPADPAGSIARYRDLLARQPGFAEAHFRLARLLERAGRWDEAYEHFIAARDFDGLPIRCVSALQDAYRSVASRHEVVLVDGQSVFHEHGPHGLLDDHLFHDAMHPSVRGHVLLAEAVLAALHSRRAFGWKANAPAPVLDPAAVASHFGIDAAVWKTLCERAAMFYWGYLGARRDQAERRAKYETYLAAARRIGEGEAPDSLGLPNIGFAAAGSRSGSPPSRPRSSSAVR